MLLETLVERGNGRALDLLDRAAAQQRAGRLGDACHLAREALGYDPTCASALSLLGVIRAQQGAFEEAADLLGRSLTYSESAAGRNNLGLVLQSMGRLTEALCAYERALALAPAYTLALNNLGSALAALQRHGEAIERYQAALAIDPDYVEALINLGVTFHALGRHQEAVERFESALRIQPDQTEARLNLGHTLATLERYPEAISAYEIVVQARPGDAGVHLVLADALRAHGRTSEARVHYDAALDIAPDLAPAHGGLAIVCLELGRLIDAERHIERALALDPHRPGYFQTLGRLRKIEPDDRHLGALMALKEQLPSLSSPEAVDCHFALGKALSDLGRNSEAFDHLVAGNALKRRSVAYNEASMLRQTERIRSVFSATFLHQRRHLGDPSQTPIFIVGMPRSGSTLVEQILASHPKVFGAGEVGFLAETVAELGLNRPENRFPSSLLLASEQGLADLGARYVSRLREREQRERDGQTTALRICDKMLSNFRYCGLIRLALPNARIIHTRRDPIETCLSCFSIQFAGLPYAYDLAELGTYYRAYASLMDHWRRVLMPDGMLEMRYEELVRNFDGEARRLVAFCGLEWDDACARFYEAERLVRTSSVVQVRQPIYQSSLKRWRPEAEKLNVLFQALGAESEVSSG